MDVNEELKCLRKFTKRNRGGGRGCSGWEGVRFGGVRVDLNEKLKFFL